MAMASMFICRSVGLLWLTIMDSSWFKRNRPVALLRVRLNPLQQRELVFVWYAWKATEYRGRMTKRRTSEDASRHWSAKLARRKGKESKLRSPKPREGLGHLNTRIPENLLIELKVYCAKNRMSIQSFVTEAIRKKLRPSKWFHKEKSNSNLAFCYFSSAKCV